MTSIANHSKFVRNYPTPNREIGGINARINISVGLRQRQDEDAAFCHYAVLEFETTAVTIRLVQEKVGTFMPSDNYKIKRSG